MAAVGRCTIATAVEAVLRQHIWILDNPPRSYLLPEARMPFQYWFRPRARASAQRESPRLGGPGAGQPLPPRERVRARHFAPTHSRPAGRARPSQQRARTARRARTGDPGRLGLGRRRATAARPPAPGPWAARSGQRPATGPPGRVGARPCRRLTLGAVRPFSLARQRSRA
jgi:hypothetical protein